MAELMRFYAGFQEVPGAMRPLLRKLVLGKFDVNSDYP